MHRLFAALPVPEDIAAPLTDLQKGLTGASWRPVENFHITLRYFGEVETVTARELDHLLGEIHAPQMQLSIQGVGWFGRKEPFAVWARIAPNEALSRLAGACERAARRMGFAGEKRRFNPHITLAYCHGTPLSEAMQWSERFQTYADGPFWADRFHLYESLMGRGPSRYVAEADYPLV
jgi:RNA 2',3'-cyclic 3'-phosphodiesterase